MQAGSALDAVAILLESNGERAAPGQHYELAVLQAGVARHHLRLQFDNENRLRQCDGNHCLLESPSHSTLCQGFIYAMLQHPMHASQHQPIDGMYNSVQVGLL